VTAVERVQAARRVLIAAALASAVLWGSAVVVAAVEVASIAQRAQRAQPSATSGAVRTIALLLGVAVAVVLLWRARAVLSPGRVALWIEERVPQLQYALVTASDPALAGADFAADRAELDAVVSRAPIASAVTTPALRTPLLGAAALLVATGVLMLGSASTRARIAVVRHDALEHVGVSTPIPNRLATLRVRVTEPAYAGGRVRELDDPSTVSALVGSTVTISGTGGRERLGARLDDHAIEVGGGGGEWRVLLRMTTRAAALTLTDRSYERSLAVIPIIDRPPTVTLDVPSRDTVWLAPPTGALAFAARARDDIGLASGHFEYTVTTGSGEVFKARTGTFADTRFDRATEGAIRVTLPLASLSLGAGDVLSVRAVVADGNDVTGPGVTTSDTRTFRVARPGDYDSVSVEAAPPPPVERSFLTERMLINSAESLYKARASLPTSEFKASAGRLGADQASLRKRVYDILYQQDEAGKNGVEGDDEELDPQLVINRDLKDAYDAMWDAERSLNVAEIPQALPAMTRALRALDRARLANRLYLRGRTPRIVVNVEKARLTGKDKGASNASTVRAPADTLRLSAERALDAAVALPRSDRGPFIAALTRLRVATVATNAAFSDALGAVIDSARAGRDVTGALGRARRALVGTPSVTDHPTPWLGAWPGSRSR